MTTHEFVFGWNQLDQLIIAELGQIDSRRLLIVVNDFVNASIAAVVAIFACVMALILVVPIDDIDRAILIVSLVQRLRPAIVEIEEILPVLADKS